MLGAGARVVVGMALAGVLVLGVAAMAQVDLDRLRQLERVELQGEPRQVDRAQIEAVVAAHPRGFLALDLDALRGDLVALPWVESVQLRKRWPDTLEVQVIEPLPVARWGGDRLVDRHGEIFGPVDLDEWQFLPALEGEAGRQVSLMHRYLAAAARLADAELEVSGVRESARRAWIIQLEGGGEVLMGRDDDLARLDQLVALMPILRERNPEPLARVDLRYPRGVAVAWQEAPAESAAEAKTVIR
ncbi:cell division protein FtsQ/DivIB [Thioalkalivibrio paradoxus]|uniref:cell division protein FtsQ/DivIB n=1 Tax=Thioalkalivibrio paradoxus TaxID=108010 RepID=UPI00046CC297|nr:cell division protein FtsQ/DivIB [Thioalkalivibrio paradoxus]